MPLNMRFRFSPAKDGLVKVLGPLETEIMQIIWQDERSTVKKYIVSFHNSATSPTPP